MIAYDDSDGWYDHVMPPAATPPDDFTSQFAFHRFGVRVPAILISPYIPKGAVDHRTFDHTSIAATLKEIFALPEFLTKRDAAAQTFSDVASLDAPRTDAPQNLNASAPASLIQPSAHPLSPDIAALHKSTAQVSRAPLSDLQQGLVDLAHTLDLNETPAVRTLRTARRIEDEYDAAVYVREVAERFAHTSQRGGWM